MNQTKPASKWALFSWALYDWANSAFATSVMVGFFPVFFNKYWSVDATGELAEQLAWWANCLGITGAPFDSSVVGGVRDVRSCTFGRGHDRNR